MEKRRQKNRKKDKEDQKVIKEEKKNKKLGELRNTEDEKLEDETTNNEDRLVDTEGRREAGNCGSSDDYQEVATPTFKTPGTSRPTYHDSPYLGEIPPLEFEETIVNFEQRAENDNLYCRTCDKTEQEVEDKDQSSSEESDMDETKTILGLPHYDGTEDFGEWLKRFNRVATAKEWSEEKKKEYATVPA